MLVGGETASTPMAFQSQGPQAAQSLQSRARWWTIRSYERQAFSRPGRSLLPVAAMLPLRAVGGTIFKIDDAALDAP